MLKRLRDKIVIISLITVMIISSTCMSYAGSGDYLALGADLTAEQMATVLSLLDVDDVEDYTVITITNADEHQYLDSYVPYNQIGNVALSSVKIKDKFGSSIKVETHNIGYCTEDMYRNALATAGVEGAKVIVAGPYEISGTAALVGAIKIYEQMSGESVDDEVIEAAVDEITTTGELSDEIGEDGAAEAIIAKVKEDLADNPDMSDDELKEAIKQAAKEAGVTLTEQSLEKIKGMLKNLQNLDIDWDNVKEQSGDVLKNLKSVFEDVDIDTEQAKGFLQRAIDWVKQKIG